MTERTIFLANKRTAALMLAAALLLGGSAHAQSSSGGGPLNFLNNIFTGSTPKGNQTANQAAPTALQSGAALFSGDAIITPAISVLSAVEGLKLPAVQKYFDFSPYVLGITIVILFTLFVFQSKGTAKVAAFFASTSRPFAIRASVTRISR